MKNIKNKLLIGLFSTCAVVFCISICSSGFNHTEEADKPSDVAKSQITASASYDQQEPVSASNIQEQHSLKLEDSNHQENSSQSTAPEKEADEPSGHVVKIDNPEVAKDYQETIVNAKPDFSSFLHAYDEPDIGWKIDRVDDENVLHVGKAEHYNNKFVSTLDGYKTGGWFADRTKIHKVVIDEEVSFICCDGLFGCIDPADDQGEKVQLMDVRKFEGLDKIDLTNDKFEGGASYMFVGCDWAVTDSLPKGLNKVTNAKSMFNYTAWTEAEQNHGFSNKIMHQAALELTSATKLKFAFANNKLFTDFDGSNLKPSEIKDMSYMLSSDYNIKEIDISGWTSFPEGDISKNWAGRIIGDNNVYIYCDEGIKSHVEKSLPTSEKWKLQEPSAWWGLKDENQNKTLYLSALETVNSNTENKAILKGFNSAPCPWYFDYSNITSVVVEDNIHLKFDSTQNLFQHLTNTKTITGLEKFDVTKVQDMSEMFYGCSNLQTLDVSSFNTAQATKFTRMFVNCASLTKLDLSSFNTAKVTNFDEMFKSCSKLTKLDLSSFSNPNQNINLWYTFESCENLETIIANPNLWQKREDLSGIGTFKDCRNLVGHSKNGHSTKKGDVIDVQFACVDVDDNNRGYFTDVDYKPTPIAWQAMQAEANGEEKPIDFYPAFNSASDVEGYKFAVKNGDEYQEIENSQENPISMESIYHKLQEAKTKTLYYHKTDSSKAALKCYTTRNLSWKDVFNQDQDDQGVAKSYNLNFVADYQTKNGIYNGIVTAEIGVGGDTPNTFGSGWDNNEAFSKDSPKINNVDYSHNGSGFYKSYGGSESTVLSIGCDFPFGSYYHRTSTDVKAFYYSTEGEIWTTKDISTAQSVVLAKEFGGPEKPQLKSLILKEIIGGVKQNVQYFPIAGDSLGENIKFYDANLNPLQKTGADGKYKQSDLTRAVLYTGDGSFKTLRSILESWDNTFDFGATEGTATKIKDTFKENHLVGGNEDTEQVYRFNGDKFYTKTSPTYEGVSLTEIWNTYKSAGFCGSHGRLWSASAENESNARFWNSYDMQWYFASRGDPNYYYVLACREFNSALH